MRSSIDDESRAREQNVVTEVVVEASRASDRACGTTRLSSTDDARLEIWLPFRARGCGGGDGGGVVVVVVVVGDYSSGSATFARLVL